MSERQKVFKGLKSQTIIVVLLGVIDLVYFSAMSRLLTKAEFGMFAVVVAVTSILQEITSAGLGSAIIQKKKPSQDFIATAFSMSLCFCVISSGGLIVLSQKLSFLFAHSDDLTISFILMAFAMFFSIINGIGRALYMRRLEFLQYGKAQICCVFASNLLGVIMAYYGLGLVAIVSAILLNGTFMFFYLYVIKRMYTPFKIKWSDAKEIVSYGGWLTASGIVRSLYDQVDKLITSRWLPMSMIGAYNRPAGFLTSVSGQVNGIFDTILFPILSNIQDNPLKIQNAYRNVTEVVIISSLIFSIVLILGSNIVITIFMGKEWLDLTPIYIIISCSVIFLFYGRIGDSFFRSLGIVKEYFWVRVSVCLISVLFVTVGCQNGIFGLAIAVLLSRIADNVAKIITLWNKVKINHIENILHVLRISFFPFLIGGLLFLFKCHINSIVGDFVSILLFFIVIAVALWVNPKALGMVIYETIINRIQLWIQKRK